MTLVMNRENREAFLSGPHVGVLAVERADRAPLAVPLWYDYSPGGEVFIMSDREAVKTKAAYRAGRLTLVVQQDEPPYKYVSVEGPVVSQEDEFPTYDQALQLVQRYLPELAAKQFLDGMYTTERTRLIRMRPDKWLSNDHSKTE